MSENTEVQFINTTAAEVLLKLWESTTPLGLGYMYSSRNVTLEDAKKQLEESTYVDYFYGKPIKTDFSTFPILDSMGYDRDAGKCKMEEVAFGIAKYHGPTKKLTEKEESELYKEADKNITLHKFKN